MKCEILSIGTELLLGDILNTNAQFLSKELANLGLDVYYQGVVGDNKERILKAFEEGFKRSEIILTTGGLGPTKDDLTKELAAEYLGLDLKLHKESLESIKDYFEKLGRECVKSNEKQAYFPEEAIILKNNFGTAPGAIMKKNNKTIIILPGPPKEMKPMFLNEARPYLEKLTETTIVSDIIRIFGVGESKVDELLEDLIRNSKNPTVAPYAKEGEVILRVTSKGSSKKQCEDLNKPVILEIKKVLKDNVYGMGEDPIQFVVAKSLIKKGLTIGSAESCTGGLIAARLIDYPGVSSVFLEGAVTYSNEAKIRTLKVREETLDTVGAVSEETAIEMAEGIAKRCGSDIGISTTGIAGPGGGTEEKPVGLVYIGIYVNGKAYAKRHIFTGNREAVRNRACMTALDMVRRELLKIK
ncbi:competence/damage-inducible protein A [Clostridium chrysemydis]|uniref:competence/damage-inducible protein A n=1 Tax=Clostridium chrysemydis TaxID=2665504 RepID=UPI0018843D24|nr:competence/damage-inducible protein A [Clostridium chrysemydis]